MCYHSFSSHVSLQTTFNKKTLFRFAQKLVELGAYLGNTVM